MKRTAYLSLVTGFVLLLVVFAGCIEGSFAKTETVLIKLDTANT